MPKNNNTKPSFKHYISKSIQVALGEEGHGHNDSNEHDRPTVRELLSRSRAEAGPSRPRGTDWDVSSQSLPLGAWGDDVDRPVITGRRAAGPAAPPSWRIAPRPRPIPITQPISSSLGMTRDKLIEASSLLSQGRIPPPPKTGVPSLTEYVFRTVIRYLDCEEICWIDEDGDTTTLGQILRDEIAEYDIRFKTGILASHASNPEPRLSDKSIRSLLVPPGYLGSLGPDQDGEQSDDWDEGPLPPMVHHLGITLHPNAYRLLKLMKPLPNIALTSLDLAYSTIPADPEKFVTALPTGLKELGLAGVKLSHSYTKEFDFRDMLGLLGKRLTLLHTLDLSYPPFDVYPALQFLLHPPDRQLPSLRRLGLRGIDIPQRPIWQEEDGEKEGLRLGSVRKVWIKCIMKGRRYVEVVWE